nr:MAG TPA_asm: hypothetical protein [Caudoviricetes sp.]
MPDFVSVAAQFFAQKHRFRLRLNWQRHGGFLLWSLEMMYVYS